jgi:branched-chain amino acid transport system permease protein
VILDMINQIAIYAIFAVSLNLLLGYAGQFSVSHAAFGAVGGYAVAYLSSTRGIALEVGLVAGVLLGALAGVLIALPAMRLRAEYLILLTLAFQALVLSIVENVDIFGGAYGLPLSATTLFGVDVTTSGSFLILSIPFAVVVALIVGRLAESPYGRVLRGIREDEFAVRSLGKNVVGYKVAVLAVTSAIAALAGGLLATYSQLAAPGQFTFDQSIAMVAMVIIGGTANVWGSIVGAAAIVALQYVLEHGIEMDPSKAGILRLVIYGVAIWLMILVRPQGIVPEGVSPVRFLRRRRPTAAEAGLDEAAPVIETRPAPVAAAPDGAPVLEVRGVSKRFGAIVAADGVSFELHAGTVTALVGPNGAGKTTVFSLLTGFLPVDAGRVLLGGVDVTGKPPHEIARAGMVRSFQDVRLVPSLTALQNVMLGVQDQPGESIGPLFAAPGRVRSGERAAERKAAEWLRFVGRAELAQEPVGSLGYGDQKRIALARVLATEAPVLLLDEPTSGIDPASIETVLDLVADVAASGRTVCIVEHNLDVVRRLAASAYFMELGRIVAHGPISELMDDRRLVEVYFGGV